jgi:hypothetical protein
VLIVLGIGVAIALVLELDWERKGRRGCGTRDASIERDMSGIR